MSIPRPEHPKPHFQRERWLNLNGTWTFCFDHGKSGHLPGRDLQHSTGFEQEILVPFCPESACSGVGHTDFIEAMWYHRTITVPTDWSGQRILLHFGAVDYEAEAYINSVSVGCHAGGSVSFCFDITERVEAGASHQLVVRVRDELRGGGQPSGKQSVQFKSAGCHYTRTTGIWQTVWLEAVAPGGLRDCWIVPDLDGGRFLFTPRFRAVDADLTLRLSVTDQHGGVHTTEASCQDGVPLDVELPEPRPWSPDDPYLYDVQLLVLNRSGQVVDQVSSYAGLRKIHVAGDRVYLNNGPLYQRLVLDQGFYPDGIWTAPSDAALRRDIELSMAAGFNGARLHQKVFEERFHYWADRLGYLTWGESASWGCDPNRIPDARNFLGEWREIVQRDRNHPSIIAWTPFNETHVTDAKPHHRTLVDAYELTKALDPTRPVNDASGYTHVRTDLWTVHHYEWPDTLREHLQPETEDGVFHRWPEHEATYAGQPYLLDEFGGLKWIPADRQAHADNSWGYGGEIESEEDVYRILEEELEIVLSIPNLSGYCYTQLTDVEQEQNGIYCYDRSTKFDMDRIAAIFGRNPGQSSATEE